VKSGIGGELTYRNRNFPRGGNRERSDRQNRKVLKGGGRGKFGDRISICQRRKLRNMES
jgi:hypothetical protein